MTVEIVPPGQREEPGPEVTLDDVVLTLIEAGIEAAKNIAIYPPKQRLLNAIQDTIAVMGRHTKE